MPFPRTNLRLTVLAFFLIASAVSTPAQQPPVIVPRINPGSMKPQPVTQGAPLPGSLPTFEFRSGFWVNLHHFLYEQSLLRVDPSRVALGGAADRARATFTVANAKLTPEEQRAWDSALDYYSRTLASKDLLENYDMVAINDVLASLGTCPDLSGKTDVQCDAGLRKEMTDALTAAAPVYRAHWWADDDRANRAWIDQVSLQVQKWGVRVAQQLALVYRGPWPRGRLAVDVVNYAGPLGAYTTFGVTSPFRNEARTMHITVSSRDPRNLGTDPTAGFDVLFYEASHGVADSVNQAIEETCREEGKLIPRDLYHAMLFYTTGEIVERETSPATHGSSGPDPQSYDSRSVLLTRGWSDYAPVLQSYWQPYLDGRVSFLDAVQNMVASL
jgi:hypothetical protein